MHKRGRLCSLALALCLVLPAGLFTGCNAPEAEEPLPEITLMLKVRDSFHISSNAFADELGARLGMKITLRTVSYSSYADMLDIMMLADDLPDIVQVSWNGEANLAAWAAAGSILPVDLAAAPNLAYNLPSATQELMRVGPGDEIYGVPGRTMKDYYGCVIRVDWLEAVGLPVPKTLDEYLDTLRAFTWNDPNGTGRDDTYGFLSWRLKHLGGVFGSAFQVDYMWNTLHADPALRTGAPLLREAQQNYMQLMDFARALYDEGLLDSDFTSIQNAEAKFALGRTGMIGAYTKDVVELENALKRSVPEAKLAWILPPCDEDGRVWNFGAEQYGYHGAGGLYGENAVFVITKSANYDAALAFLNAMNSREMILFANLGIQGVHYESYDEGRGIVNRTAEQKALADAELFGISDSYGSEALTFSGTSPEAAERMNYYWKLGHLLITNPVCYNRNTSEGYRAYSALNPFIYEVERSRALAYVTGGITREEYEAYLEETIRNGESFL